MRTVATILLAAAVGIHCSAPAESERTSDEDVITAPPGNDDPNRESAKPGRIAPPSTDKAQPAPTATDAFVVLPSLVLSSVVGPDGATYIAGTYAGTIEFGGSTFTSTGKEDVFVARVETDGSIAWARSIGSHSNESGPKLSFEDNHLKLVATTRGEVDCGAGPLGTWNSEMFFLCTFDGKGSALGGASFPTGAK